MTPTAFPLSWPTGWPRTAPRERKSSRFTTGYMPAYENLQAQLRLLSAASVLISSNAPLRRDGKPYTEAMNDGLEDPGVAVYFTLKGEPRVMARDGHHTPAENLHAIGHVIESLRTIDRHGGSYMMARAFSAFTALPVPCEKRPWREVLSYPESAKVQRESIDGAYRQAAKLAHPDAAGGSHDAMAELNRARDEALREIG